VTAGRSYRQLAGLLLLTSLLPMPFLYIVMPAFWLVAAAVGAMLLVRPKRSLRLSQLVQNGLAIVIVAAVAAAGGARLGPLRPLGHLLLLLAAVRAAQVADRRSYLRALPLLVLVWVVSLTASTHLTVLAYFAVSAAVWWWAGMQTQLLGVTGARGLVRPRHAAAAALVALLLSVPLFLVVPRLRSPWIAGRGSIQSVTGFSSRVELAGMGPIARSQERALVLRSPFGRTIEPEWTRLRATAYERVTVASWAPRSADRRSKPLIGTIELANAPVERGEPVELEVLVDRPGEYLFLPEGTVAVEVERPVLIDPAGGLVLQTEGGGPLAYTVWINVGGGPLRADPPQRGGLRFEPHPEVRALAERIARGLESAEDRARAVEAHLQSDYAYSMSGMGRIGPDPMSWFLLRSRSGHCEYFAGGMVVLLDAIGVPARMVGGYSGGSASAGGDELVVREANAHAWVEVWLGPERGWTSFDPTPAANVPGLSVGRARDRLRFAWEWLQSSWDRYVLTFGMAEQMDLLSVLGSRIVTPLLAHWRQAAMALVALVAAAGAVTAIRRRPRGGRRRAAGAPRSPAARAIARLVRRLERSGVPVPAAATVRWIGRTAAERWPQAAGAISELAQIAERDLYAAEPTPAGAAEARRMWSELRRAMRGPRDP
jgi:transglutaminase-like putative cysteine protease